MRASVQPLFVLGILLTGAPASPIVPGYGTFHATVSDRGDILFARAEQPLRFTTFDLYSDTECKNIILHEQVIWDPNINKNQISGPYGELNGAPFRSARFTGGANAQTMALCQQGASCFSATAFSVTQQDNICSTGGGPALDKIVIKP
jgi:hypothetical protein